jgi:hypothetical protein
MKLLIIMILLITFFGCNSNNQHKLVYDKIVFTKGTFQQPYLEKDNIPDTIIVKQFYPFTIFASRSIVKIEGSSAVMYFNEFGNSNKGYYKATLNDSIIDITNKLLGDIDFTNIIDSSRIPKPGSYTYDGFAYYLFLTKNGKTKEISFIDAKYYRHNFSVFVSFIDSLENKVNMVKLIDSIKTKQEFDSLKKSIVDKINGSLPPLKSIKQFLPAK